MMDINLYDYTHDNNLGNALASQQHLGTQVRLPFGLNENNTLVHVSDVNRGKACGCVCPGCRSPLIAAKGKLKQHHFRHDGGDACKGGIESAIHLAAKQIISERKQITLPEYNIVSPLRDSRWKQYSKCFISCQEIEFESVEEEVGLNGIVADVLAKINGRPLVIEIFYRHKVDDEKIDKIKKAGLSAIEIDLSELTIEDLKDWEHFWSYLNDIQHIQWLNNAKVNEGVVQEIQKQLAREIREQEKIYKQEEVEFEKTELLEAIEEIQYLKSEEHIDQLEKEALSSPAWKYFSPYVPFEWEEFPEFINKEIPDGDWIFGCDRRLWQSVIYGYFILHKNNKFSIELINDWLNEYLCAPPRSVYTVWNLGKRYKQLLPVDLSDNLPWTWRTLRAYFDYLCEKGILECTGHERGKANNRWYKVLKAKNSPI